MIKCFACLLGWFLWLQMRCISCSPICQKTISTGVTCVLICPVSVVTSEMYQLLSYLPEDNKYRCHMCAVCPVSVVIGEMY